MDPLSQAAFGAAAAQIAAPRKHYAAAIVAGSLGGMAADLDIFIQSSTTPTLGLFLHRHFTHSLPFVPVGGLCMAVALWGLLKFLHAKFPERGARKPPFKKLWLFSTLGYATHGLVDTLTSYGTVLLWPFTETRFALDWVSIIDPIITLPLLFGVWLSFYKKSPEALAYCSLFVLAYIAFLGGWHTRTTHLMHAHLTENHITAENLRVMPVLFKPLKYRAVYIVNRRIEVAHISTHLNGTYAIAHKGAVLLFDVAAYAKENPKLATNVQRYAWFADGFIAQYATQPLVLGDFRYGRFETPLDPLWGLEIDEATQTAAPMGLHR